MMRSLRAVRERSAGDDSGFTLIELLMVSVLLPLVMGALAAALIVSIDTTSSTKDRLSGSVDAQLTGAYFVRDSQGAGFVTTTTSAPWGSSTGLPQVCGSGSGNNLLIAMFHRATPSGPAQDVAYWQVGSSAPTQVIRYYCTVNADYTSSVTATVIVADNVTSTPPQMVIQPSQFATAAATGWVPTVAQTYVTDASNSPSKVGVASTAGFAGGSITASTNSGSQLLTGCTVQDSTHLTCAGGPSLYPGESLSQDSVSGLQLTINEVPSSAAGPTQTLYHYVLTGTPRTQVPWGAGPGTSPVGGPNPCATNCGQSLITLSCAGISLNGNTSLAVNGNATVDCGPITCSGTGKITVSSGTFNSYPSGAGCGSSAGPYAPDPVANYLPPCVPVQSPAAAPSLQTVNGQQAWILQPGRYTGPLPATNNSKYPYFLEPGLYELDQGLNLGNQQTIQIDPRYASSGQGVLLYVPPTSANPGCATGVAGATVNLSAQGSADIPPFSKAQWIAAFPGNTYPSSPSWIPMWVWQDQANSTSANLGGGTTVTSPNLAYLPSAIVTLNGGPGAATGSIICAGLVLKGGSTVTISGS